MRPWQDFVVALSLLTLAPERLVLKVSSHKPGVLVGNETFYPGWKATVDGQSALIRGLRTGIC